jgi:hypothetical protein
VSQEGQEADDTLLVEGDEPGLSPNGPGAVAPPLQVAEVIGQAGYDFVATGRVVR